MSELAIGKRNSAGAIIFVTLILAIGYAVLRYHIAGPVPWKDFPMFILNKGLCLAGFILLTFNFTLGPLNSLGVPVSGTWTRKRIRPGILAVSKNCSAIKNMNSRIPSMHGKRASILRTAKRRSRHCRTI